MNEVAKQEAVAALWQLAPICREPMIQLDGPCNCWQGILLAIHTLEAL
jgi:hypothetical protein